MKKSPYRVIVAIAALMFSCSKNVVDLPISDTEIVTEEVCSSLTRHSTPSLKSIDRKGNPYAVSSMRLAFTELQSQGVISFTEDIDDVVYTTHYYIKFAPQSDDEIKTLLADTTLILYSHPLDNNNPVDNDEDSVIPEDESVEGVFYYTAVPVGTALPTNIEWEILEELYIPDEYNDENDQPSVKTRKGVHPSIDLVESLVQKSFELTNNEDDYISPDDTRGGYERWRPSGRITAYDNIVDGAVPIRGILVRARRWFITHIGCTDCDGYFSCNGRFKRPANYSFAWEGDKWDIRDGYILQAYYNGPKIRGPWNLHITGGKSLRYSAIHRAAYRFYHGNVCGLTRPANKRKEKIGYFHYSGGNKNGDYNRQIFNGLLPDIRIFGANYDNSWRDISQIYSTASHELGHSAHYLYDSAIYANSDINVLESWARCVQFTLTNQEYKELGVFDKLNQKDTIYIPVRVSRKIIIRQILMDIPDIYYNFQDWRKQVNNRQYTPIFIDIVDDYRQKYYYEKTFPDSEKCTEYPDDRVDNFPVDSLEKIVFHNYTMPQIKVGLFDYINKYPEAQRTYNMDTTTINDLFAGYDY